MTKSRLLRAKRVLNYSNVTTLQYSVQYYNSRNLDSKPVHIVLMFTIVFLHSIAKALVELTLERAFDSFTLL